MVSFHVQQAVCPLWLVFVYYIYRYLETAPCLTGVSSSSSSSNAVDMSALPSGILYDHLVTANPYLSAPVPKSVLNGEAAPLPAKATPAAPPPKAMPGTGTHEEAAPVSATPPPKAMPGTGTHEEAAPVSAASALPAMPTTTGARVKAAAPDPTPPAHRDLLDESF